MASRSRKSVRLASPLSLDKSSNALDRFRSTARVAKTNQEFDYTNWHGVTVSARKILWPCLCACCGGSIGSIPESEAIMPGIHVVKMNIADFEPFYCHQCQSHQAKAHRIDLLPVTEIPRRDSSLYVIYACGCFFSPCTVGLIVSFFDLFIKSSDTAYIATYATLFLLIAAVHITVRKQERRKIADAQITSDRIESERHELETEANRLRLPTCTSLNPTVRIAESHGTRHKFMFVDESLAKLFRQINEKKVITQRVDLAPQSENSDLD